MTSEKSKRFIQTSKTCQMCEIKSVVCELTWDILKQVIICKQICRPRTQREWSLSSAEHNSESSSAGDSSTLTPLGTEIYTTSKITKQFNQNSSNFQKLSLKKRSKGQINTRWGVKT